MTAYYNEIDPYAAEWLRNLIRADHIAPGDVDTRSILEVSPDDLRSYTQCHFFAGIGVWSHALRRAGWPDDREVWTGSCPCQPFSMAGLGAGFDDERHLWPFWHYLIEQRRPRVVFGEQVEAAVRLGWLDLVQADLEGIGYACGPVAVPAGGVGAPNIRQRLWFVADANEEQRGRRPDRELFADWQASRRLEGDSQPQPDREAGIVADAGGRGVRGRHEHGGDAGAAGEVRSEAREQRIRPDPGADVADGVVADDDDAGQRGQSGLRLQRADVHDADRRSAVGGFWSDAEWIPCRDGKWRPVEPGTFPLAHGAPARVGRLRAYGNAINAEAATEVIAAYLEVTQ